MTRTTLGNILDEHERQQMETTPSELHVKA